MVDAYGTEAEYNHPEYSAEHGLLSYYGGLGLNLKQFYTFFRELCVVQRVQFCLGQMYISTTFPGAPFPFP